MGRWEQAVNRALERVNRLSREDKLAIALHDFAAVTVEDFVPFDYCDGPNGVRGHEGATAFPVHPGTRGELRSRAGSTATVLPSAWRSSPLARMRFSRQPWTSRVYRTGGTRRRKLG